MKRPAKIVLGVVVVIVLGFVVVPMIFLSGGGSYRREVEAYKRDLLAKGEKLTMVDFFPPQSSNDSERARRFTNMIQRNGYPAAHQSCGLNADSYARGCGGRFHQSHTGSNAQLRSEYLQRLNTLRDIVGTNVLTFDSDYSEGVTQSLGPVLHVSTSQNRGSSGERNSDASSRQPRPPGSPDRPVPCGGPSAIVSHRSDIDLRFGAQCNDRRCPPRHVGSPASRSMERPGVGGIAGQVAGPDQISEHGPSIARGKGHSELPRLPSYARLMNLTVA